VHLVGFIIRKAVAIETSCVCGEGYAFLRLWERPVYLLVMSYKLLLCEEIPWYRKITVNSQNLLITFDSVKRLMSN
jgi:hypothetical protein